MKHLHAISISALMSLLGACSDSAPPPPQTEAGREETQNIRNTEAIGVGGQAIGEKVDTALDANDARKAELDKALEGQ